MNTQTRLIGKEEIERACDRLEDFFGEGYFKRGVESLKESDPAGAGMGRMAGRGEAPDLLTAWYRAREELIYADLQGVFLPGLHSALAAIVGSSLEDLRRAEGIENAARALLDSTAFDRTAFLLRVAAELSQAGSRIAFPGPVGDSFYAGGGHVVLCRRAMAPTPAFDRPAGASPHRGSPGLILAELVRGLPSGGRPDSRQWLYYLDISDLGLEPERARDSLEENCPDLFRDLHREAGALVLSRWQFSTAAGGIRWHTSNLVISNKKK